MALKLAHVQSTLLEKVYIAVHEALRVWS